MRFLVYYIFIYRDKDNDINVYLCICRNGIWWYSTCIYIHIYIYICMYTYTHIHGYIYIHMCVYMYIYIHPDIFTISQTFAPPTSRPKSSWCGFNRNISGDAGAGQLSLPGEPWKIPLLMNDYRELYGYGSIPINTILMGWTSIYQLFWCSPGVQGFDTLPYMIYRIYGILLILPGMITSHDWTNESWWFTLAFLPWWIIEIPGYPVRVEPTKTRWWTEEWFRRCRKLTIIFLRGLKHVECWNYSPKNGYLTWRKVSHVRSDQTTDTLLI